LNKTLFILKPDTVEKGNIGNVLAMVESAGFRIRRLEMVQLTPERARGFYAVHEGKPFMDDLVEYMTSGPCVPVVLEGENVIPRLRELMGATDASKAAPDTIRGRYGVDISTNAVHGSDSPESAGIEIPFFFPEEPLG
jgi:nucleoside-diphosphate kinase